MSHSLNEVDALAKRATRGAGYGWGHAEEAGKAVRWLSRFSLPGPCLLAAHLSRMAHVDKIASAPRVIGGVWRSDGGALCPLLAGAALSDRAFQLVGDKPIELADTAFPLLLAPYLAIAASRINHALALSWDDATLWITNNGLTSDASESLLAVRHANRVTCRTSQVSGAAHPRQPITRTSIDAGDLSTLSALAAKCYAPATEASRLKGAGAGPTDND